MITDTQNHVVHEPFGLPFYWSAEAPSAREATLPRCADTFASVAYRVFRQPPPPGKSRVFVKDHAYYFLPHCLDRLEAMGE